MYDYREVREIFKSGFYARQFFNFQKSVKKQKIELNREVLIVFFCSAVKHWGRRRIAAKTNITEHRVRSIFRILRESRGTLPRRKNYYMIN